MNVARALMAPAIFFAPFLTGLPAGYEIPAALLIYVLIGDTNYILHLHIHRPFSKSKKVNLLLDMSMGSVTGMVASNWRIQHLYGHHRGDDTKFRGNRTWELEKYSTLRMLSFCSFTLWPTFWQPFIMAFRKGVAANETSPINYRWAFAEHVLLFALVGALALWQPWLTFSYLFPLYFLTYFITRYVDYLNHYGCDEGSANKYDHANNCLNSTFNRFTHNFGYHTAHHLRPGAHWSELPDIYQEVEHLVPEARKKQFSWSWMLLPYHVVLSTYKRM